MENSDQLALEQVPPRTLGAFDLVCLGWNCVIGSGIFLSQGLIASSVGSYGPLLFLLGGLLCLPIGLCFGQLAQRYSGMGGSALYARQVFGRRAGFVVGWVMWLSGIIGGASVAVGFASVMLPHYNPQVAGSALLLLLAAINLMGTASGAWSNNLLAVAKLVPLVVAAGVGLVLVGPASTLWPGLSHPASMQWKAGLLAVLYAYSGFEEIALPAGEVKDSTRNVPRAIVMVLLSSSVLYTVLQGVVCARGAAAAEQPLQAAFLGSMPWLSWALVAAAAVSFASVNASIAFTTPRSLWTLAHHGWLPTRLLWLYRGAPSLCILISASLGVTLIAFQGLEHLIALSVLAALLQHLAASLACWKLRGWGSRPGLPQLSVAVCLLLLCTSEWEHMIGMGISLVLGGFFTLWVQRPTTSLSDEIEVDESQRAW